MLAATAHNRKVIDSRKARIGSQASATAASSARRTGDDPTGMVLSPLDVSSAMRSTVQGTSCNWPTVGPMPAPAISKVTLTSNCLVSNNGSGVHLAVTGWRCGTEST
jgi:hypothetical protein